MESSVLFIKLLNILMLYYPNIPINISTIDCIIPLLLYKSIKEFRIKGICQIMNKMPIKKASVKRKAKTFFSLCFIG